jgi:hypothetical protein
MKWYHPERNDFYIEISENILGFFLCDGTKSIGSIISYETKEEAILDGWKCNE